MGCSVSFRNNLVGHHFKHTSICKAQMKKLTCVFWWQELSLPVHTPCTTVYMQIELNYITVPVRNWHHTAHCRLLAKCHPTYRLEFLFIFSFMSIGTFTRNPGMDTSWIHTVTNTELSFMRVIQLLSIKRHVAFLASPSHFPRLNILLLPLKSPTQLTVLKEEKCLHNIDICNAHLLRRLAWYGCQVLEISWKSLMNSIGRVNYSRHAEIKIHSSPRNSEFRGILSHFVVFSAKTSLDFPVFSRKTDSKLFYKHRQQAWWSAVFIVRAQSFSLRVIGNPNTFCIRRLVCMQNFLFATSRWKAHTAIFPCMPCLSAWYLK